MYKNSSEYFSANSCNKFAIIPLISNYKGINHKKNSSMSSNFITKKMKEINFKYLKVLKQKIG